MAFVKILVEKLVLHFCHDFQNVKLLGILYIRGLAFSKNLGVATKSRHQKGYVKQVPYSGLSTYLHYEKERWSVLFYEIVCMT